jgi:hypothetical protein
MVINGKYNILIKEFQFLTFQHKKRQPLNCHPEPVEGQLRTSYFQLPTSNFPWLRPCNSHTELAKRETPANL